jgi:hypothetical protein
MDLREIRCSGTFVFHKILRNFLVAAQMTAPQEGLSSVELAG